jgi:hypothetical protein
MEKKEKASAETQRALRIAEGEKTKRKHLHREHRGHEEHREKWTKIKRGAARPA